MTLWDIPGQQRAVTVLTGALEREEVGHAWAFIGPAGTGQSDVARSLAAAVNCPLEATGCGSCDVCARARRGAHPDYWEFVPTGASHRVSEVREQWLPTAFRTAAEGGWKVLRIVDADRMNDAAANAFLKGLEEPPPQTLWVLDVADPEELPDTILSRCRAVPFQSWSAAALEREALRLGMVDAHDRGLAVRASSGLPGRLAELAAPGGLDDLRMHRTIPRKLRAEGPGFALVASRLIDDEVKRRTAALKDRGRVEVAELEEFYSGAAPRGVVKQLSDRLSRQEREARTVVTQAALDDLGGWYRDVLLVGGGGAPADAIHADDPDGLCADAKALPPATVLQSIDLVLATRERLESNVQQQLALEALFLDLATLTLTS